MDLQEIKKIYPEAVALVGMAESVWYGNTQAARIDFALSDRLKAELKKLLGKNIESIFITDSDVKHIKKKHGQREALRGQVDITPADFALIPFIMNEFDTAEHTDTDKLGNKKITFTKNTGETVFTVSVERGNNQIGVITLWKRKPARVPSADSGNPPPPLA
ncbi:MAG: hypothetical protein LBQ38_10770 [Spirochaetaceae bacterium]|jgi:hypothetical protein|nr:hypothetical protein [Spirochaetaceae bacterium]